MKILVADDNAVSLRVMEMSLHDLNHELLPAKDGEEAYKLLMASDGPRIAIIDNMMPNMTGFEVCRKLRKLEQRKGGWRRAYVIIASCSTGKEEIVEALDAGASDYVIKPYSRVELQARLRVAVRTVEFEIKLQEQIEMLTEMVRERFQPPH